MMEKKASNIFIQGPISAEMIAESIKQHSSKSDIGAHNIFLGQIRKDIVDDQEVCAIEYTSYEMMAITKMQEIKEEVFAKYNLICMHVLHSLGKIQVGEICLFVFTSSKHRKMANDACQEIVERIKNELPIWGREIFGDGNYKWKENC